MNNYLGKGSKDIEEKLGFYFGRLISYPLIPPEHVYFCLTTRCNLRCRMCDIPEGKSEEEGELTTLEIKNIILQIKDMGIKHLIFSGGEPLLRGDLLEIVEFAVDNNIEMVDIITNGVLLNDVIMQRLIEVGLSHITISLDGLRETNDKIRGRGVFEQAESKIDKFNYYKSKYNSPFPTVGINFTAMDKNIDDILPIVDFARAKKCNIVVFQPVLFNNTKMYDKRRNSLWPSKASILKLKDIIRQLISLKDGSNDLLIYNDKLILESLPNYFKGKRPKKTFKCYEAIKRIVITYNGKLWSCKGIYGNLKEYTLKKIWFSPEAAKIRANVKECREHCLQDCVYFPSGFWLEIRRFLKKLKHAVDGKKIEEKKRLLKSIDFYIDILSSKMKPSFAKFSEWFSVRKELGRLRSIRKEIIKTN